MTTQAKVDLQQRAVDRVVDSLTTREGGGFLVHRPFPTAELSLFDPFLLLEGMRIAGRAVGATRGFVYVRSEYPDAFRTLNRAVAQIGRASCRERV